MEHYEKKGDKKLLNEKIKFIKVNLNNFKKILYYSPDKRKEKYYGALTCVRNVFFFILNIYLKKCDIKTKKIIYALFSNGYFYPIRAYVYFTKSF